MCQLMGMSCNKPAATTFSFTGFSARGGLTSDHIDGWGIAFYDGKCCRVFQDDQPASHSPLADYVRRHPIKSKVVVAHVRKATQGDVQSANCHPFQREWLGRTWVFAHNGNLVDYIPRLHGNFKPVGQTDSELAFCWLMQELAKSHASVPSVHELSCTLRELVPQIARQGTFNFLLSNGQALWAHASTHLHYVLRQHPFSRATLSDEDLSMNFAEHTHETDRVAVVVTQPLTTDESWVAFEPERVYTFEGGGLKPQR